MSRQRASIVIVDDAAEVRSLIRTRLRLSGAFRVVGEGGDGREAVDLAREQRPDLMLLDVSMAGMDGLEALPHVRAASPGTRVVVFSGFEEHGLAEKALELGAAAFVEKSTPVDELAERLLTLATGDEPTAVAAPLEPDEVPGSAVDQALLDEHLERFREVFEEAAIGMATMTLTGRLVRVNHTLAELLAQPAGSLVGTCYPDLADRPVEVEHALEEIRTEPAGVVHLEHGLAGQTDGRQLRATMAQVRDSGGRALYLFLQVQDVTAERAALEELRKSEERFRLLVDVVEDYAIFMLDPRGHIVSWNAGAERTKGYTAEEIIGQHFRVFYPREVAERGHPEHELEVALREGHYGEEGWRLRKDGSRFWANVLITAVFNEDGEHIGFTKVTRDNSERRRLEEERERAAEALAEANAELESLNARLQQAAAEQSQFLAVTAHELRTPVSVLSGSADTLAQHWSELTDEERSEMLGAIGTSSARLRRLLSDLLTTSRLERSVLEMHAEPVRVADIVARAVGTVRRTRPEAEIRTDVPLDLVVHADHDRAAQALDNLIDNAFHHGRPPVDVAVRKNAASVDITVHDEGYGVAETLLPRLFDRFATGRREGGTGLGLFIVREIARAQGGDAFYAPDVAGGRGATFVLRLPVVA